MDTFTSGTEWEQEQPTENGGIRRIAKTRFHSLAICSLENIVLIFFC